MNFLETCFPLIAKSALTGQKTLVKAGETTYLVVRQGREYLAYPENCPHRGTPLSFSKVSEGSIQCPYHGWKIETSGKVIHPSEKDFKCEVPVIKLEEHFDCLWMNQSQATLSLKSTPSFTFAGSLSTKLSAPFHVVLDNFNEGSHTAFVHQVMGSKENQVSDIQFQWEDKGDHVFIKYLGPQRPNIFYNGPFWKTYLNWDISWKTYPNPVHMIYHSKWVSQKTGKKWWMENLNVYYLIPCGEDKTWLHSFTFIEIPNYLKIFSPMIKLLSRALTKNQIIEDEEFYPAIKDLPFSFKGLRLDKFDHPLPAIRKKIDPSYFLGKKDSE
jgi:phenylpropionate dioxygenase-like ring-hydroxylating dioxygenase large terminal subunit